MRSLLVTAILLFSTKAICQDSIPPAYLIQSDTASHFRLPLYAYKMLEDKSGKLSFQEVSTKPINQQFVTKNKNMESKGYKNHKTLWTRYRLKNTMNVEAHVSCTTQSDTFDVYLQRSNGKLEHYRSGKLLDWQKRDGIKIRSAIPLIIYPGEEVNVYERRADEKGTMLSRGIAMEMFMYDTALVLANTHKMVAHELDERKQYIHTNDFRRSQIVGLLILACCFNLLFYFIVKEKVYLYFALFTFFFALTRVWGLTVALTQTQALWLSKYVQYFGIVWAFFSFFHLQFHRYFFEIKNKYPRWDKFLQYLAYTGLSVGIAPYLVLFTGNFTLAGNLTMLGAALSGFISLCIGIILLLYIRSDQAPLRIVARGALPALIWDLVGLIMSIIFGAQEQLLPVVYQILTWGEVIVWAFFILLFSWTLFMRFDKLRKENIEQALSAEKLAREQEIERSRLIAEQKENLEKEVAERTADLKQSYETLQATQAQLIQSEKLASLGELTAGIAHEIQNPLNFVNNFAEVSAEMIDELKEELEKGDIEEVKAIAEDLQVNLGKINHHGGRASSIVKGMLEHSRASTGVKEPTNLNALADEYLRLAYHGLRAKDNKFNATMETHFDPDLPLVSVIPQDIGRVVLNLINNAFYAVDERSRSTVAERSRSTVGAPLAGAPAPYHPTVTISTQKAANQIIIKVQDNGPGIPEAIRDKIFQPFFTTKPTGQGTGLGLSLAYDIITKGHGGKLYLESIENQGSTLTIELPFKNPKN